MGARHTPEPRFAAASAAGPGGGRHDPDPLLRAAVEVVELLAERLAGVKDEGLELPAITGVFDTPRPSTSTPVSRRATGRSTATLRDPDRTRVVPYLPYLRLLFSAVSRGVAGPAGAVPARPDRDVVGRVLVHVDVKAERGGLCTVTLIELAEQHLMA
ncbi:hypothetical protein [Nonomuraea jabiensis]|uniref:Uncharacterized protein n=1 Tax=Nonomuraea jabiensis TaxID=882448 RepID=A0A7W9G2Y2_9ACTN|nr:hypothetical protein [Nonomuraea jabiensis]MBB5776184.1 hypothetical protein [Nonomuraea jabiensis]